MPVTMTANPEPSIQVGEHHGSHYEAPKERRYFFQTAAKYERVPVSIVHRPKGEKVDLNVLRALFYWLNLDWGDALAIQCYNGLQINLRVLYVRSLVVGSCLVHCEMDWCWSHEWFVKMLGTMWLGNAFLSLPYPYLLILVAICTSLTTMSAKMRLVFGMCFISFLICLSVYLSCSSRATLKPIRLP